MISEEDLNKFKDLYKKHFNEDLSNQDALDKASRLLRFVEIVLKSKVESRKDQA
jgi:hypothetical protein